MKYTPVLSLDGGGARALFFLQILKRIEAVTGKRTADLFRLICGTSAGGIVALALTCSRPRRSAAEVEAMFLSLCPVLFKPAVGADLKALWSPRYSQLPLVNTLHKAIGLTRLSEADTAVMVTTFALESFEPIYLTNLTAAVTPEYDWNWYAVDAALATSAGPTMFAPHQVGSASFVDGGLLANNPALLALHLVKSQPNPLLLSLGTGVPQEGWKGSDASGWGELRWISSVLAICMDGAGKQVHEQCEGLLPAAQYLRAQVTLADASADQSTPDQLASLIQAGEDWVEANDKLLNAFIDKLMETSNGAQR